MKKAFSYICALLCGLSFVFTAHGQDLDGWSDEEAVETEATEELDASRPKMFSAVKCFGKTRNGYVVKRYLMIEYPWSKIQNATLEVRIVGQEAEKQPQFCKPVYFKNVYGKLEKIEKDIFNKKIGNPRFRNNIEYEQALFHEYGLPEPNAMELATIMPVSGARADYFYMTLKNSDTNELETTLVFHDLEQWAVDNERLAIELHGKRITDAEGKNVKEIEFEKPCKIKIWLLHDDFVVWEETFQWPGTEKDRVKKSTKKNDAPNFVDDDEEDPRQAAKKMEDVDKAQNNQDQTDKADEDDADFDGFGEDF